MTLTLSPMLLLLFFFFLLAPSPTHCDGGKGIKVLGAVGIAKAGTVAKGTAAKGIAVAKGTVAKGTVVAKAGVAKAGVAKAVFGGPAKATKIILSKSLAKKALALAIIKGIKGKAAKSTKLKLSKLLAKKALKKAIIKKLLKSPKKKALKDLAKSKKDKLKKLLDGGKRALTIIKGLIIANHLPYLSGKFIGKTVFGKDKRDVSNLEQLQFVDAALEQANQADSGDCVPKLLCYLEAMPEASLSPAGLTLRKSLGNVNKSDYLNTKTSHGVYGLATAVGATLGRSNASSCDMVFQTCPLEHTKLLEVLNSTFT